MPPHDSIAASLLHARYGEPHMGRSIGCSSHAKPADKTTSTPYEESSVTRNVVGLVLHTQASSGSLPGPRTHG